MDNLTSSDKPKLTTKIMSLMPKSRPSRLLICLLIVLVVGGGLIWLLYSRHKPAATPALNSTLTKTVEPCLYYSAQISSSQSLQDFIQTATQDQKSDHAACLSSPIAITLTSPLTISGAADINFDGSKLTKASSLNNYALSVTASDVSLNNLQLNGNGTTGGGINLSGANETIDSVNVSNNAARGINLTGSGSSLNIDNSSSDNNIVPSSKPSADQSNNGIGIAAGPSTKITSQNTSANNNSRSGFYLFSVANGSQISGYSANNRYAGLEVNNTNNLYIHNFTSTADWHYGVYLNNLKNCTIDSLNITNTGMAQSTLAVNSKGAGVEFFGSDNCYVGSINVAINYHGTSGYGVAIARYQGQGSDNNTFQNISVSGTGNPGLDITGTSSNNTFEKVYTANDAVGVNIGEGTINNDNNTFEQLSLVHDWYGGLGIEGSSNNLFKEIDVTDQNVHYPVGAKYTNDAGSAIVRILSPTTDKNPPNTSRSNVIQASDNNIISEINVSVDQTLNKLPHYIVYADAGTSGNQVTLGSVQTGSYKAATFDDLGSNSFH